MPMTNKPKCAECKHLIPCTSEYNNHRSNWYCKVARTECEPHRRIAQAKGDVIPTKTSPRWCPLREEAKGNAKKQRRTQGLST